MYKWLFTALQPHVGLLIIGGLAMLCHHLFTWLLIPLSRQLAPLFNHFDLALFGLLLLQIMGMYLLKGSAQFLQTYLWEKLALSIICDLRASLYANLLHPDAQLLKHYHKGDLLTRFGDDIDKVKHGVIAILTHILPQSIMLSVLCLTLIWLNWLLCLSALLLIPLLLFSLQFFNRKIYQSSQKLQNQAAILQDELQESMNHYQTLQLFHQHQAQSHRFQQQQNQYQKAYHYQLLPLAIQSPFLGSLQVGLMGLLLLIGGWQVSQGWIQGADLLAFGTALALSIDPTLQVTQALQTLQKSRASWERLNALNILPNQPLPQPFQGGKFQGLELKQLRFSHPESPPLFKNLSLTLKPGDKIGLIGRSGIGKSTLLALISEQLPSPEPDMLSYQGRAPWKRIMLPQIPAIFNRSLKANICLDQAIPPEYIEKLLTICQLQSLVSQLPQGMDTNLGNWALSGGEKQRICLARALAFQPEFLILDESTSELDPETETQFYQALLQAYPHLTLLVVSHRPETLRYLDKVYLLNNQLLIPISSHSVANMSWYAEEEERKI